MGDKEPWILFNDIQLGSLLFLEFLTKQVIVNVRLAFSKTFCWLSSAPVGDRSKLFFMAIGSKVRQAMRALGNLTVQLTTRNNFLANGCLWFLFLKLSHPLGV